MQAVRAAIASRMPFVLYVRPFTDRLDFFADPGDEFPLLSRRRFTVSSWAGGSRSACDISDRADADTVIALTDGGRFQSVGPSPEPWHITTPFDDYINAVDDLIDRLRDSGGKTVISRTICASGVSVDWLAVADTYFAVHPEAFRYIYYTPRHGFWLGASPELLLKVDSGRFSTMALAGTRPLDESDRPWSGKNIAEQAIVRNYIVDRLYDLGLAPETDPTETVTTGNIQHLRTLISGSAGSCSAAEIIDALNPTPALAGYPMAAALENIVACEAHPRRCYGGYVALTDDALTEVYVNLRCVAFDSTSWCIYVGGGIMPDSDSAEEWRETEAKSLILRNLIVESTI